MKREITNIIRKIWNKFFSIQLPHELVMFNIVVCCGLFGAVGSFIASLFLEMTLIQVITIVISIIIGIWCFVLANFYSSLQTAIIGACSTIALFVFPTMFFTGGGLHSGMPIWLVLGMIFAFLLLRGKKLVAILCLEILVNSVCLYIAYKVPDSITPLKSERAVFIDIWQSLMVISLLIGMIIRFQNTLYKSILDKEEKQNIELEQAREETERAKVRLIEANKALSDLAYTDIMTSLFNRTAFERKMSSLREADDTSGTIIMIADINNLKQINDEYGHSFGDDAIIKVSACLRKCFDKKSSCYRIGGDEYCVISENTTDEEFQKWYTEFEEEFSGCVHQVEYPFSIATGYRRVDELGVDICFKYVDAKMYSDKSKMKKIMNRSI